MLHCRGHHSRGEQASKLGEHSLMRILLCDIEELFRDEHGSDKGLCVRVIYDWARAEIADEQ